jgi:glucose/arabinose dehydrogenase
MSKAAMLSTSALVGGCLLLTACGDDEFDISQQYGPDPVLPAPTQSLLPDLKVAEVVGWQEDQVPTVPEGLVVTAYAKDLANPRTVHTLPNGDVLVVQSKAPPGKPLNRPKDIIRGFIMDMAASGAGGDRRPTSSHCCGTQTATAKSTSAAIS